MKAISIKNPWAHIICLGLKPVENRTWKTNYRGRILIHAGLTWDHAGADWILHTFPELRSDVMKAHDLCGGIIGSADLVDCVTSHPSQWFEGPYGFVMENAQSFEMIAYPGQLSLFNVPAAVLPGASINNPELK